MYIHVYMYVYAYLCIERHALVKIWMMSAGISSLKVTFHWNCWNQPVGPTCHNIALFPDTKDKHHHFSALSDFWNSNTGMRNEAHCTLLCKPGTTASMGRLKNDNWDHPNLMPVAAHISLLWCDKRVENGTGNRSAFLGHVKNRFHQAQDFFDNLWWNWEQVGSGIEHETEQSHDTIWALPLLNWLGCCFYFFVRNSLVALLEALCHNAPIIFSMRLTMSKTRAPTWNASRRWASSHLKCWIRRCRLLL